MCVFFFKQKTAYEMRISDWSSDVCSSDLRPDDDRVPAANGPDSPDSCARAIRAERGDRRRSGLRRGRGTHAAPRRPAGGPSRKEAGDRRHRSAAGEIRGLARWRLRSPKRSEEHTSELQSLMRISYAVFCLKKKKNHNNS